MAQALLRLGRMVRAKRDRFSTAAHSARKSAVLALLALPAIGAFGAAAQRPQPLPASTPRIHRYGFSVLLPQERGWFVVRSNPASIALAKPGKDRDSSYVLYVQDFRLPDLATPQAFQKFVDESRAKDTDPKRFTELASNETLVEHGPQGALCLRYEKTVIDRSARTIHSKSATMNTAVAGFACRSPYDPHLGVTIVYSRRYRPSDKSEALTPELDALVSGLQFEPLKQRH